nr:type VI secretion system-associated FHA domain protein TagH [Ramlibacter aurantiacus]
MRVESFNGSPVEGRSATFDELGGTIGRADNNQLVLPDPERSVSRLHARIVFRGTGFAIVDHGANAITHNGRAVGQGREVLLYQGDRVEIGGFVLAVSTGAGSAAPADPFRDTFADLFGSEASAAPARPPAGPGPRPPAAPAGPLIPDDWDPFASTQSPAPAPPGSLLDPAPDEESLDKLFQLGGDGAVDAGRRPPPNRSGTPPDHDSDLNAPWPTPGRPRAPAGPVLSWDQERPQAQRVAPLGGARTDPRAGHPAPTPEVAPGPERHPAPADAAAEDARLQALLDGLGLADLQPSQLDAARLRNLGLLLREATQGTVQLLQARAAFKRELRARVTMIAPRENNPLKFAADGDTALHHLLRAGSPAYMQPEAAMRDAYDDLQAHQLAVMAGMRAAVQGLLEQFSPASLEQRITQRGGLSSLLPSGRKAQLWEQFAALYGKLSQEAEDGFYDLFGSRFLEAYEAEIQQLRQRR